MSKGLIVCRGGELVDYSIEVDRLATEQVGERIVHVAFASALDLVASGDTPEQAKAHLAEMIPMFIRDILRRGVAESVLTKHGWKPIGPSERLIKPPESVSFELVAGGA